MAAAHVVNVMTKSTEYNRITDDLLSAYIDDAVTEQERSLVETAIAADTEVAWRLDTLQQTVLLLRSLPELALPRSFTITAADVAPSSFTAPAGQPTEQPSFFGQLTGSLHTFLGQGSSIYRNLAGASLALLLVVLGASGFFSITDVGLTGGASDSVAPEFEMAQSVEEPAAAPVAAVDAGAVPQEAAGEESNEASAAEVTMPTGSPSADGGAVAAYGAQAESAEGNAGEMDAAAVSSGEDRTTAEGLAVIASIPDAPAPESDETLASESAQAAPAPMAMLQAAPPTQTEALAGTLSSATQPAEEPASIARSGPEASSFAAVESAPASGEVQTDAQRAGISAESNATGEEAAQEEIAKAEAIVAAADDESAVISATVPMVDSASVAQVQSKSDVQSNITSADAAPDQTSSNDVKAEVDAQIVEEAQAEEPLPDAVAALPAPTDAASAALAPASPLDYPYPPAPEPTPFLRLQDFRTLNIVALGLLALTIVFSGLWWRTRKENVSSAQIDDEGDER